MLASATPDGRGLTLAKDGIPTLRYAGLTAHDKVGHELRTWLDATGDRLRIRVDDAGAQYPLVVDPIVQQATLTASDGEDQDSFWVAVAVSGDTAVVGAQRANQYNGEAYIFVKPLAGWGGALTETARLGAIDFGPFEAFGAAVAISGDTVVVGARFHVAGEAYVFVKPAAGLPRQARNRPTDPRLGQDPERHQRARHPSCRDRFG
jgi:FG-GAP repeat